MRRALVTGGSGFVGRYMIEALDSRGFDVQNVDLVEGIDCRDYFRISNTQFDLVVHLAAIVGGRATIEGDPLSVATDLSIDSDMFNWAVRTAQPHVIYYSSSAAYPVWMQRGEGKVKDHSLVEADINLGNIFNPDMTYGWAKLTGEYLAKFAREAGVRVDVFRPFSGYGTDQSLDYPFMSFIRRATDHSLDEFEIWGTGHQVRDWIHITDVVEGSLMWAEQADESVTVNLCTGRPTSFIDLAKHMMRASGNHMPIKTQPNKPTGVMYRVGNPQLMHDLYTPKLSLEDGIARALKGIR